MTRMLKALGLAASAVAAMAALTAPAAQAETGALTAEQFPAILTGQQVAGFTMDIGEGPLKTVTCGTSDLVGTIAQAADPVTLKPVFGACVSEPGAMPVTITPNECDYTVGFTRPGTTGQPATTGTMQAAIDCPVGQQIEIHIYENAAAHAAGGSLCTYHITAQGPVAAGVYHNVVGMPNDVTMTVNAAFTAKRTAGPLFLCGGAGEFQHLPIRLTGTYTLGGFQDFEGVEGAPVGLHVA